MTSNSSTTEKRAPARLPSAVTPSFYDMRIEPDLDTFTFKGQQAIKVDLAEPTTELILNSAEIDITEAVLTDDAGTKLLGKVSHDQLGERATIKFDGVAGSGTWELGLKFAGLINDKLKGFYRSVYKDAVGKEHVLVTTKFEPCDARRAFPSFDEPAMKARFKVSLVIDEKLNAVSNSRLLSDTSLADGKKLLQFAPSIKMSSYLVAYRVGNFVATEPVYADGKPVRVWCVPGKEHLAEFALTVGKYALEYFSRWFQHPYPGDKLDMCAIPAFASGAMEEFGVPGFRETALLMDLKTASHAELLRVAEVIFHEIAHMWFGDLVTMRWWNGLWLNEGFATFMAAMAMDDFRKDWKFWEGFNVDRAAAMKVDGLIATRSIEFPVNYPEEARGMFDILTYEKGCAILRMLQLFLGEEPFRHGLVNYVEKHQYDNADTPELWSAIEEVVAPFSDSVTVSDIMNSWVFQPGYPLIEVVESEVTGSVTLKQKIFRYLAGEDDPKTLWHVPIHLRATVAGLDGQPQTIEKVVLLSKESETFYLGEGLSSLVVNSGGHGFYRVRLSDDLRKKLMNNLGVLTASERFNFVSDMWASVQSGLMPIKDYFEAVSQLVRQFGEMDLNVVSVILEAFKAWRTNMDNCTCGQLAMQDIAFFSTLELAERILVPIYDRVGRQPVAGEAPQQAQLRGRLMAALGEIKHPEVVELADQMFAHWKTDRASIESNLLGAVIQIQSTTGDASRYAEFNLLRASAPTPQEESKFLMAMANFRAAELANLSMRSCLDKTFPAQDALFVLQALLGNTAVLGNDPKGGVLSVSRLTWQFIKDNWDVIVEKFPMQSVSRMCTGVTALIQKDLQDDVREFFATHPVKSGEKAVKQTMEQVSIAYGMLTREHKQFTREFLNAGGSIIGAVRAQMEKDSIEFKIDDRDAAFTKDFFARGLAAIRARKA